MTSVFAFVAGRRTAQSSAHPIVSEHGRAPNTSQNLLSQAQKMESLGRFTGGVAHDFNNLLTVVLGNATALRVNAEARGDAQAVRRAEMIERAAERGARLTGQLLAFSGKQLLQPEVVSVYQAISATSELLAQAAGETARVRLYTEKDLWNCRVDPGQLESAIVNLVLNARDATPAGGNITIGCYNDNARGDRTRQPERTAGDYVRIDVQDTGSGIPSEMLDKVFEPFFTTKPIGQGSGLGLAQVYGFAGQSGGWVELQSVVGKGTTISLFLPRERRRSSDPSRQTGGQSPVGQDQSVLVVEPDPDLRSTTCETLIRSGYRALAAANGSAALAHLVSGEQIHLLLTEAQLSGGISGVELARSARQLRPELRVLITSGTLSHVPADSRPAARAGDRRFEFLTKPYRPTDLISVVGTALTSELFSLETEELLADARASAPLVRQPNSTVGVVASVAAIQPDVLSLEGIAGAVLRTDTIRLGVMPFRTIGLNTDNAFALGLAEEITKAFSRFRSITCAAPASVAALAAEPRGDSERWRQLDLDFLVEGSFRKKGNDIRVLLRLFNMRGSGEITWGRRFDSLMPDVLNLQDQIASETAAQIVPELIVWNGQTAASRPQVDPTAYDLMLRAIPAVYRMDEAGFREAGALLERSLALDPTSAGCHSWLAHWYLFSLGQGWQTDTALATERADHLSQQAVILDPGDARGFTVAGHVRAFLYNEAQSALWLHERAIALNPNMAMAWCYSGLAYSYLGQHAEAINRIRHAQHLSPHDPHAFFFDMALGMPFLLTGQYDEAVRVGRQARDRNPGLSSTYKGLLAALGHLGASREASTVRKALLLLEPGFSISAALARSPLLRAEDRKRYSDGLRLAGIS
jgi:nitrogen-specific signal transduction histidine kinase/TolB-like protein/FixJ family two-component response regulator